MRGRFAVIVAAILFTSLLSSAATNFDFRAFYCAGAIVAHHGNPYLFEPLHSCERSLPNDPFTPYSATTALPAPLPGYALSAFVPFSVLPFLPASRIWTLLLCAAILITIAAIRKLTHLRLEILIAAFLLSLCAGSLGLGELVPVVVAAISVAALAAQHQRWIAASIASAVAMIEPHLGLPVAVSMALWMPRTRAPLAFVALGLAALSLLSIGLPANLDYFTGVLPAHALSEIGSDAQLSLSVILFHAGMGTRAAIAIGTVSYVAAVVCGIVCGRVLARRYDARAFLILTPAAFAVAGGTFIHITQMAAALPLALLLWARAPRYRIPSAVACVPLAVPWRVVGSPLLVLVAIAVVFVLSWELSNRNIRAALLSSAGAFVLMIVFNVLLSAPPMHQRPVSYSATLDPRYAEASWARYNDEYLSTGAPERWLRRIPTWFGLLVLYGATVGAAVSVRAYSNRRTAQAQHAI